MEEGEMERRGEGGRWRGGEGGRRRGRVEGEGRQLAMFTKCREPAHVSFGREMCWLLRVEM